MATAFEALAPLLIANAAMLAMVSLRNSDIATRARKCRTEQLYGTDDLGVKGSDGKLTAASEARINARREKLRTQIKYFHYRYWLTSFCFVLLAISIACLGIFGYHLLENPKDSFHPTFLSDVGVWLFGLGVGLICVEFVVGPITLDMNAKD
jgi:hypothetical protein